jgi:uncharacterized FlaG/YvyC family protein
MDVQTVATAGTGQGGEVAPTTEVAAAPQAPATSSGSSGGTQNPQQTGDSATLASVVAKLYNVGASSYQPTLAVSYKYVSDLQLVVTVFTNPETGEEIAQFPPQELIGLAEFFDQIDGVTLDKKV